MNLDTRLPLTRERFFPKARRSVAAVREFADGCLDFWYLHDRRAELSLCVSELATNALRHGVPPGRGFRVRMVRDPEARTVRVEVHDSGPGEPRIVPPAPGEPSQRGRGLLLVAALADAWGVEPRRPGKVVWCEFRDGVHASPPPEPGAPGAPCAPPPGEPGTPERRRAAVERMRQLVREGVIDLASGP
ncbi:ATP-binding protein [Streptomyces sp. NPDC097619]|uniref:ATP-binding protein n=1 Tax=Streptomyces sp. NPDC097619 TaxID=3157228 RepID=UPI003321126E